MTTALHQNHPSFLTRTGQADRLWNLLLVVLSLTGVGVILVATRWGAALSDDSFFYIKPARDLLAGSPVTFNPHYTPLIPFLLALIGLSGVEPLDGIRYLNSACFGLNILMSGQIIRRASGSWGFGLAGGLLVLVSSVMVEVHSWAMSEALFITCLLACFLLLSIYFERGQMRWAVLAGVACGLAILTRYAGFGVLASGVAFLVLNWKQPLARRVQPAAAFAAAALLFFAGYAVHNWMVIGQPVRFGKVPLEWLDANSLRNGVYEVLLWVMPGRLARGRELIAFAALAVVVLAAVLVGWWWKGAFLRSFVKTLAGIPAMIFLPVFIASSIVVLYLAHMSPVYKSPFDARLLSPTHIAFLLLLVCLCGLLWREMPGKARWAAVVPLVFLVFLYAPRTLDSVKLLYERGAGYASSYWHEAEAIDFIEQHRDVPVVTTAIFGVYFHTGYITPNISAFKTPEDLRQFLTPQGYLLVFHSMPLELYGMSPQDTLAGLKQVQEFSNCTVYQIDE